MGEHGDKSDWIFFTRKMHCRSFYMFFVTAFSHWLRYGYRTRRRNARYIKESTWTQKSVLICMCVVRLSKITQSTKSFQISFAYAEMHPGFCREGMCALVFIRCRLVSLVLITFQCLLCGWHSVIYKSDFLWFYLRPWEMFSLTVPLA